MEEIMTRLKKYRFLKTFTGMVMIISLCTLSFPFWAANGSGNAFSGGDGGSDSLTSTGFVESYVIEGAGFFLDSYSFTLQVMKKVEWSGKDGLNFDELNALMDMALENMEQANASYRILNEVARKIPYNPIVIAQLEKFDFDSFAQAKGVNKEIFTSVRGYLEKGDVRGVYVSTLDATESIITLLQSVKKKIDAGVFPSIPEIWQLNQEYSQTLLFGQYVAQVFDGINKVN